MKREFAIRALAADLLKPRPASFRAVVGLDGFIDEVVRVVDHRTDSRTYAPIETIAQFGQRISRSAGMSSNIEMVTQSRKIGGNGAIFAGELIRLGADVTYIGTVGVRTHDPVFDILIRSAEVIGIAEPGKTDAIEFDDGKIISSKLDSLNAICWADVRRAISPSAMAAKIDGADLVSFNNWTMIPAMSEIWKGIIEEVLPLAGANPAGKLMFIDLADPEKRRADDIREALSLLEQFEARGFRVVFGLNQKEAFEILKAFGNESDGMREAPLEALIRAVAEKVCIHGVAVHPVDGAGVLLGGAYAQVDGPVCAKPKITTGAGDHFNAGFVCGLLLNLPLEESLLLGVSTSGYYVRTGVSPTPGELAAFAEKWASGNTSIDS